MRKSSFALFIIVLFAMISCSTVSDAEQTVVSDTDENSTSIMETLPDPIDCYVSSMTMEEKIGQLIIINVRDDEGHPYTDMNETLKDKLIRIKPGGVLLFGGSIRTIPQTFNFIGELQAESSTPLFICTDVEGGIINRLRSSDAMHATPLPSNGEIGRYGVSEFAFAKAGIIGRELHALGINMNFAPVADVLTHPDNTVIGERSFGSDPYLVASMIDASVRGMRAEKVATVIKHFPGHGDTVSDSHLGTVSVEHDLQRLRDVEFIPFQSGIAAGTDGVMTAHIQAPFVTGTDLPATLSRVMITDLLRRELGFEGLIITDSLEMGAISSVWDSREAAVLAVNAGVDLLLNPENADDAYNGLLDAYKQGLISEDRVNASVYRILLSKMALGIMDENGSYIYHNSDSSDPEAVLGSSQHLETAQRLFGN